MENAVHASSVVDGPIVSFFLHILLLYCDNYVKH